MAMTVQDDASASYKLLAAALKDKHYTVHEVPQDDTVIVSYVAPSGLVWQTDASHIQYPGNSDYVRELSIQKGQGYAFARERGFPVPYTTTIVDGGLNEDELRLVLDRFEAVIVKPADSSLGKGLTIDITTMVQLRQAVANAREVSSSVLVQQQVYGQEIRFTVIDGKVVAALLRETARVIGDGMSTVAALIQAENDQRKALKNDVVTYPQLDASIIDESLLQSDRILAKDEVLELASSTMIRGGCSVYDVLSMVHPSYVEKVESLVAPLGASLIVVDVFCAAYTQPAAPGNYWLIEFNTAPVLKLFYACRDDAHFDIVPHLAETIDRRLHASK